MARTPKYDDAEILDRAMTAFWRGGWADTSIRDLERALDLKAPSIYRRFGSREQLGVAVVDHYVDRVVRRRVAKHLGTEGDPIDGLRAFLELSVTQSGDDDRLWGCLLTTTALEAVDPEPTLTEALRRGLGVIENGLRSQVERAAALDRLSDGVDVDDATATMVLAMQGLMALARSGVPSELLRERARAAVRTVAAPGTVDAS